MSASCGRWNGCWRSPRRPDAELIQVLDDFQTEIDAIEGDIIREVEASALDEPQ